MAAYGCGYAIAMSALVIVHGRLMILSHLEREVCLLETRASHCLRSRLLATCPDSCAIGCLLEFRGYLAFGELARSCLGLGGGNCCRCLQLRAGSGERALQRRALAR